MSSLWQYLEDLHGLSAVRAAWELGFGADFEAARGAFLTRTEEEARAYPSSHVCRCTLRVVPEGEGKFTGVSDCGSIGCRDVKLSRTDVLLWVLNWRKVGTAIAEAFGCDGRDADLGIAGTRQIAVAGEGNVPVVLTVQIGKAGLRNAVSLLVARLQGPFVLLAPTRRFVDGVTQGLLANAGAEFFDLESHVSVLPTGKLRADKPGKELFARFVPAGGGRSAEPVSVVNVVATNKVVSHGRLRYLPGFEDVWLGDAHYDLRDRKKARLCIQYLVEKQAFNAKSARHLTKEIDPFVRKQGDYLPSAEIKIDHYFNDAKGVLPQLRKDLIAAAGRNGKYYLRVE